MKLKNAKIDRLRMDSTSAKIQNNDILSDFNFDPANFPDMKGTVGANGYQGSVGYTGSKGDIGTTGYTGSVGYQGSLGPIGDTGGVGYTGSVGVTGLNGSVGATGYTGSVGFKGSRGATGNRGPLGYTGSAGYQGSVGPLGYQGSRGATGAQGATGYTGSSGYQGSQSPSVGFTGSTGLIGDRGYSGSVSTVTGYTGSIGDIGNTGIVGYTGSRGTTGYTGSVGDRGNTGATGTSGYQGSRGATGNRGPTGYTGSRGNTGSAGIISVAAYQWEPIRTRSSSSNLTYLGSGATASSISVSTGTVAAGDVIAMELNNIAGVSTDSTPKVMIFSLGSDTTPTELDSQHGWTNGVISAGSYFYLRTFGVGYGNTTTVNFNSMYTTTMFASADPSWLSTMFDITNLTLYGGRMWKLVPNDATDTVSNPSIGAFGACFYDSFLDISSIFISITNNHDQSAVIQYDTTSFISSNAKEIVVAAGASANLEFIWSGNIQLSSRTVAARAVVGGNQSSTITRTESVSFCAQ